MNQIQSTVLKKLAEEVTEVKGIVTFLNLLQGYGMVYGITSSGTFERIHQSLSKTKLIDYFKKENIFSAQLVERGKPAPDLFLYAARKMEIPPEECLVIEDSIAGIQAAKAAGMSVVGFMRAEHAKYSWYRERLKETGVDIIEHYTALK